MPDAMKLRMPMPPITLLPFENGVAVSINLKDGAQRVFTHVGRVTEIIGDDGNETLLAWLAKYYADNEETN